MGSRADGGEKIMRKFLKKPPLLRVACTLLLLFLFDGIVVSEESALNIPQPKVDERFELLGIVFHLAGVPFHQVPFKEYADAIDQHFASFKRHPVVLAASMAGRRTSAYTIAVHISIENGRVILPDTNLEKLLNDQFPERTARLFVRQLDDFYLKSRFREFFEANREMYQKIESLLKKSSDKIDYSWFKKFYGYAPLEHLHIVPTYIGDGGGRAVLGRVKEGHEEFFALIKPEDPAIPYPEDAFINVIVHEFNHYFCNRIVDQYIDELQPAVERTFPFMGENFSSYYSQRSMVYEYLVMAYTDRYLLDNDRKDIAERQMRRQRTTGLFWIEELVELLGRYTKERDKYPTLDDFMPEIVKMQNAIVTDEFIAELQKQEENCPKVIATNPPNGAKDVDPGITEISLSFDRPMRDDLDWNTQNAGILFPERSEHLPPVWSDDKHTCTISHVVLKPGQTYRFWLNAGEVEDFRSVDDIPLQPFPYTFTTKAEMEETDAE